MSPTTGGEENLSHVGKDANLELELASVIPGKFLNSMGFINYTHTGAFPWKDEEEDVQLPEKFKEETDVLGIDCEMVGVGEFEDRVLARVSIVNLHGYCILDTFAKPSVPVSVYNTKVSGVRPKDLENAPSVEDVIERVKKIVKGKIILGHSVHHDLEVLKIYDHPRGDIRDSADFYRYRFIPGQVRTPGLKQLAMKYLKTEIQTGEHSSIQDAQATMKLYLINRELWEKELLKSNQETSSSAYTGNGSITEMHVRPEKKDLFVDSQTVFLRPNKIIGNYESSKDYLDVQFRLLLEDFLRPLRDGVRVVTYKKSRTTVKIDRLFKGVTVQLAESNKTKSRNKHTSDFFGNVLVPLDLNNLRSIDWKMSKMFLNGSLVVLTPDNFSSVYFGVVKFLDQRSTEPQSNNLFIQVAFSSKSDKISIRNGKFLMMESRAFFEAYKHTLQFLQVMKLDKFPLKKYIVDTVTTPGYPQRLVQKANMEGQKVDFSVLLGKQSGQKLKRSANPFTLSDWPTSTELGLDGSQHAALKQAITQELCIIQGPPGCGKTHILVEIVKLFLANPWMLDGTPIMIVSFTNHALDQTLERVFRFYSEYFCSGDEQAAKLDIIRIGGCSESELIKELTLFNKSELHMQSKAIKRSIKSVETHLSALQSLKDSFASDPWLLKRGILDLSLLHHWIPKKSYETFKAFCNGKCSQPESGLDFWKNAKGVDRLFGLKGFCDLKKQEHFFVASKNLQEVLQQKFDLSFSAREDILESLVLVLSRNTSTTLSVTDLRCIGIWLNYFAIIVWLRDFIELLDTDLKTHKTRAATIGPTQTNNKHLSNAKVIGMTTTGAVKYKEIITKLRPKVMLVEEAAHVLEAHVVASLTEHCEQLILIGDHKQLRPLTADSSLSWQYKLDVSLMERLVRNGLEQGRMNWVQLKVQHRMRPEIARMVCPLIYKELKNHPDVEKYENVKGCRKNLFFMDHQFPEEREPGSKSYHNRFEIKVITALAKFFLEKGRYLASRITVIATYKAQRDLIETRFKETPDSDLANVRVSTVDGYQGEENDIVLLSLVRSNDEERVGFLKTNNRVCVALSRARHGFFITGNMSCLAGAAENWETLWGTLKDMDAFGSHLDLPLYGPRSNTLKNLKKPKAPKIQQASGSPMGALNLQMARLTITKPPHCASNLRTNSIQLPRSEILIDS